MLLPRLIIDGAGYITASKGIFPEVFTDIYRFWKAGDITKAKELQLLIPGLVREIYSLPIPLGSKIAMASRGFDMGPPKQPLPYNPGLNHQKDV